MPASFGGLADVAYLVLSYNEFTGTVPPELGMLSSLYDLVSVRAMGMFFLVYKSSLSCHFVIDVPLHPPYLFIFLSFSFGSIRSFTTIIFRGPFLRNGRKLET